MKAPRIRSRNLIRYSSFKQELDSKKKRSVIFCEAVAIYGIIIAIIMQGKFQSVVGDNFTDNDYFSGYSIFWAGNTVGWTNIACGYIHFLFFEL